MTITKEGRIWSGLSEDITRIKENAARLKELAAISFKDDLANSETREMIRKEEECLICQIDKIPLTPCKDHGREDLLQGVCVLAIQTRAVVKNMAREQMLHDSVLESESGQKDQSKKKGNSKMGILEHIKTHHGGGLAPKATTSKVGHGNKPLAKKKKQKEGLNVETGGDKEVPTPSEERR